jgi:hypothetical protein
MMSVIAALGFSVMLLVASVSRALATARARN